MKEWGKGGIVIGQSRIVMVVEKGTMKKGDGRRRSRWLSPASMGHYFLFELSWISNNTISIWNGHKKFMKSTKRSMRRSRTVFSLRSTKRINGLLKSITHWNLLRLNKSQQRTKKKSSTRSLWSPTRKVNLKELNWRSPSRISQSWKKNKWKKRTKDTSSREISSRNRIVKSNKKTTIS